MKNSFFQFSIWNTAFRPFFLFGAAYGTTILLIWIFILSNLFENPIRINSVHWHSYELVFGFSNAIVIGFIFTAAQNWTSSTILKGKSLFFLFIFWIFGRFSLYSFGFVAYLSFGMDIASNLFVLFLLIPKLSATTQKHNRPILYHYGIFTILHILAGLSVRSVFSSSYTLIYVHLCIFSLIFLIILIGGRIIPFFSNAVLPGYSFKQSKKIESGLKILPFCFYLTFLLLSFQPLTFNSIFQSLSIRVEKFYIIFHVLVGISLFIFNAMRFINWCPWKSFQKPILWILYTGYFWLCIGFLMNVLSTLSLVSASVSIHCMTIGGLSIFIYGMITRVSLGHTGRPIIASKWVVLSYILLNFSVIFRMVLPLNHQFHLAYYLSGFAWIFAFSIFIIQYAKILISKRSDGKSS